MTTSRNSGTNSTSRLTTYQWDKYEKRYHNNRRIRIYHHAGECRWHLDERAGTYGTVRGIAPTLRAAVSAVYQSGVLKEYEVHKYIRLENGYYADVFSFPMVVALAFRINTFGAEQVHNAILERLYLRKEKTNIFFSLGINSMEMSNYQA